VGRAYKTTVCDSACKPASQALLGLVVKQAAFTADQEQKLAEQVLRLTKLSFGNIKVKVKLSLCFFLN